MCDSFVVKTYPMNYLLIEEQAWIDLQSQIRELNDRAQKMNSQFYPKRDGLLDNAGVCQRLHISKRTLQYYRESGLLPYTLVGNKCYYKIEDIIAFLVLRKQ